MNPVDYMPSVQAFAVMVGLASAAGIVVSIAWAKAMYSIRAARLLRQDGARELAAYGYFPHCASCGQKLNAGVGDRGTCPNCGHVGEVEWTQDHDERARIRAKVDWDKEYRDADRAKHVRELVEQGFVFYCEACGEPITEDEWDFEDTRCPTCGHKGTPGQTDDVEND